MKSFSIFLLLSVICITIVFVIMNMLIGYPDVSNGALIMIVYIVVTLMIRLYNKRKAD
ncbi:Flp pilus assembly protein TadB [Bacillus amyloliquefaciens]|nr:Flp pilus assembly protein TadB [Bacillus amyloliquefaciens]